MILRRILPLVVAGLLGVSAAAHAQNGATASSGARASDTAAAAPTNRQLAANVRHALHAARKQGLKSTYIRVRARDGVVTLSGVVASEQQIAFATQVAQSVSGVRAVQGQLEVRTDVRGFSGNQ
ncbi:BON domain-containing protein [Paraburkholderia acidisoli]|uniref:BON domain-containing protein n=1 Tax=Paraburkholderia acidisoli TaxID=2571748 RepID=A0A7Z2JHT6_9BURK|nr:BON domain-containing protein [Paraburkholderia acidisoli]QGZ66142.1 BON domain-containing protein [Paraburkholderia acidisoli]